jgi:hypothetical protein
MSDVPLFVWVPDDDGGYGIWALDTYGVLSPVTLSPEREARFRNWLGTVKAVAPKPLTLPLTLPLPQPGSTVSHEYGYEQP